MSRHSSSIHSSRGNMSLMALASVTGGVMFAMVFANLVRYISVENALEQATQKIARCIDPTDPVCTAVTETPSTQTFDWYQPIKATVNTTLADKKDYSARVFQSDWQLSFPVYELHKAPLPPVQWVEWRIPTETARAELNPYERRILHVHAEYPGIPRAGYAPKANPNFPEYDPLFEHIAKDQDPGFWEPRQLFTQGVVKPSDTTVTKEGFVSRKLSLPGIQVFKDSFSINGSSQTATREFVTPWYEVAALDADGIPPTCVGDVPCSVTYASGGKDENAFANAHIAVKAFATALKTNKSSSDPKVKWAGLGEDEEKPDGWGLQVEVIDAGTWSAYQSQTPTGKDPHVAHPKKVNIDGRECLGGRDWGDVDSATQRKNFHLALRGAIKRKKSDNSEDLDKDVDPACPGGDRKHWNLEVPRGGAYRVRGAMKVKNGSVDADVKILSYVDSLQRVSWPAFTAVCDKTIPLANDNSVVESCDVQCAPYRDADHVSTPSVCNLSRENSPVCASEATPASDKSVFLLGRINCVEEQTVLACSNGPAGISTASCNDELAQNPGRKVCVESSATGNLVTIPAQNFACANASPASKSADCGDGRTDVVYRSDGNYGNLLNCPAVQAETAGTPNLQISVNGSLHPVAPPLFSWAPSRDYDPPKWERSIQPLDERGQTVVDPKSVRSITAIHHPIAPVYARYDAQWRPSLESFDLSSTDLQYLREHHIYTFDKGADQAKEINTSYPFVNKPEFEIPGFLPSPAALASCSGPDASLEARLRAYAAAAVPDALDPAVRFEGAESDTKDIVSVSNENGCENSSSTPTAVPLCTKTVSQSRPITCGAPIYLGTYLSPDKPQLCRENPSACYSASTPAQGHEQEEEGTHLRVNLALAVDKGFSEITRALPGSKRDCQESGCSEFVIDTIDNKETRIVARYHMPLNFPLDTILGRESIAVEKVKQELQELAIAGRANAGVPN